LKSPEKININPPATNQSASTEIAENSLKEKPICTPPIKSTF